MPCRQEVKSALYRGKKTFLFLILVKFELKDIFLDTSVNTFIAISKEHG